MTRTLATNIRNRHSGTNTSPWNEPECDLLYSRSMAHWNIFDQACGFRYDSTTGALCFDPRVNQNHFQCFVTLHGGWGSFTQSGTLGTVIDSVFDDGRKLIALAAGHADLSCLWGSFALTSLCLQTTATVATATLNGKTVGVESFANGVVTFATKVSLVTGDVLTVMVTGGISEVGVGNTSYSTEGKGQCCGGGGCGGNGGECGSGETTSKQSHAHGHGHGHGRPSPGTIEKTACCKDGSCSVVKEVPTTARGGMNIVHIMLIFVCGMLSAWLLQRGLQLIR